MNLQSFEYVRAVAREGSFTRAAQGLHVTQQTLSAHVAGLERELGVTLFSRGTPLLPTHECQAFLRHAERISDELVGLRREVCGGGPSQQGTLRVGVAYTRGRALLPPVIERLGELYPNVCVELQEDTNEAICRRLAEARIDIAILASAAGRDERTRLLPYYEEEVVLVARASLLAESGVSQKDAAASLARGDLSGLGACPLVMGGPSDMSGELGLGLFSGAGADASRIRARSNNMETLLALAMRGVGACLCPKNLLEATVPPDGREGLLSFPMGPEARYPVMFGLPRGAHVWEVTQAFMDVARELAGTTETAAGGRQAWQG